MLIQVRDALPAEAKFFSAGSSFRNLEAALAIESGNGELIAERRLRKGNGGDSVQVVALGLKEGVLLN